MGSASLAIAWVIRRGHAPASRDGAERGHEPGSSRIDRAFRHESVAVAFAAGVVLNLPGAWYIAALTDIAAADIGVGGQVALIVLFNVVMFTLVEVPLVLFLIDPARAQHLAIASSDWIRAQPPRASPSRWPQPWAHGWS